MAVIRPRQPSDMPAVMSLVALVFADSGYPVIGTGTTTETWLTRPTIGVAWVLEEDGQLLGHATLEPKTATSVELGRLFVGPAAQGRGFGRLLVQRAVDWAWEHKKLLTLFVLDKDTPARKLYERMGWVQVKAGRWGWEMDGIKHDIASFDYVYRGERAVEPADACAT